MSDRLNGLRGTPMYRARYYKCVFVTIDSPDGTVQIKLWRGRSKAAIRAAAQKFYPPGSVLTFGNVFSRAA